MKRAITNVAASKRERLMNRARAQHEPFDHVVRRFFYERFLYRLQISPAASRFVVKGAMLLQVWTDRPYRSTADLDLLRMARGGAEPLVRDLRAILDLDVEPDDGVRFDSASLAASPIRPEDQYAGVRVRFVAKLGALRDRLQIDVGTADAVWPPPQQTRFPALLDDSPPLVLAYTKETVIAEKFEAMVSLGMRNSRMKDFFDIHHLAENFDFDGAILARALSITFQRREMQFPADVPVGLTETFWSDPARKTQLRAFGKRARLTPEEVDAERIIPLLIAFLTPMTRALARGKAFTMHWTAGGPWRA